MLDGLRESVVLWHVRVQMFNLKFKSLVGVTVMVTVQLQVKYDLVLLVQHEYILSSNTYTQIGKVIQKKGNYSCPEQQTIISMPMYDERLASSDTPPLKSKELPSPRLLDHQRKFGV